MPGMEQVETVDGEPVLALVRPLAGGPAELPARLAAELGELIDEVEALCRGELVGSGARGA